MYNLLLIDDEKVILDGLYNNIEWEEAGFSNVYRAEDASTALSLMEHCRIDVIVTDISMPEMDGIQLCRKIRISWPLCKIIMLTGYREFDYARQAVELGVYQYLLKPIRYEDLLNIVKGALSELQQDLDQRRVLEDAHNQIQRMGCLMQENYLNSWLIAGSIDLPTSLDELHTAGIDINMEMHGFAILVHFDDSEKRDLPLMQMGLRQLMLQILSGSDRIYFVPVQADKLLAVFLCETEEKAKDYNSYCCNRLDVFQMSAEKNLSLQISISVSEVCPIGNLYRLCTSLREQSVTDAISSIRLPEHIDTFSMLLNEICITESIKQNDKSIFDKWILRCQNEFAESKGKKEAAKKMVLRILASITEDTSTRPFIIDSYQEICVSLLALLEDNTDENRLFTRSRDLIIRYIDDVLNGQTTQRRKLASEVRSLIISQMDRGLTVNSIAETMHYSSNYLSHLIKMETGQSLEELLISMRIERACKLLSSGMRVQEAALNVGYDNVAHFSRLFKKKMGMTPRQYML